MEMKGAQLQETCQSSRREVGEVEGEIFSGGASKPSNSERETADERASEARASSACGLAKEEDIDVGTGEGLTLSVDYDATPRVELLPRRARLAAVRRMAETLEERSRRLDQVAARARARRAAETDEETLLRLEHNVERRRKRIAKESTEVATVATPESAVQVVLFSLAPLGFD